MMTDLWRGVVVGRPKLIFVAFVGALSATSLSVSLTSLEDWVGWLPTTIGAWESGVGLTASVASVGSAWLVGQPRAHRLVEWVGTAPRPHHMQITAAARYCAAALVVSLIITAFVVGGLSAFFGLAEGLTRFRVLLFMPGYVAYMFFWVALGAFLGDRVRREVALPLSAVLPYAVYGAMVFYSESAFGSLAVGDGRIFSYVEPSVEMMAARCLFWGGLATAMWLTLRQHRRAASAAAWMGSFAAAAGLFFGPAFPAIPGATSATCDGVSPQLCVEGSFVAVLPRYRVAVAKVWGDVPKPLRAEVVASVPEVAPDDASTIIVPPLAGFTEPSRIIDQALFESRLGDTLFGGNCLADSPGLDTASVLMIWWRHQRNLPLGSSVSVTNLSTTSDAAKSDPVYAAQLKEWTASANEFSDLSKGERNAWFESHAGEVKRCAAPSVP